MTAIFLNFIFPLVVLGAPFVTGIIGLFFYEYVASSARIRHGFSVLTILHIFGVMLFPTVSPFFNYMIGLMSIVHAMRFVEIFFVTNPPSLKRLQKIGQLYYWEPMPPPYTMSRIVWALDLVSNSRGIGWRHGPIRYLPSGCRILDGRGGSRPLNTRGIPTPNPRQFLWVQVQWIVLAYLWFDLYNIIFVRGQASRMVDAVADTLIGAPVNYPVKQVLQTSLDCLINIISARFFLGGMQAFWGLVAVGVSTDTLGTTADIWMWPPIFGAFNPFERSFQGLWGNWWHDILQRPFYFMTEWLLPPNPSQTSYLWTIFGLTGVVHAVASYVTVQKALPAAQVLISFSLQPIATVYLKAPTRWRISQSLGKHNFLLSIVWVTESILSAAWFVWGLHWFWTDPGLAAFFTSISLPCSALQMTCSF